jgi:hypothetical protein
MIRFQLVRQRFRLPRIAADDQDLDLVDARQQAADAAAEGAIATKDGDADGQSGRPCTRRGSLPTMPMA